MRFRAAIILLLHPILLVEFGQAAWSKYPGVVGTSKASQGHGSAGISNDGFSDLQNYVPDERCNSGMRSCEIVGAPNLCCPEIYIISTLGVAMENTCVNMGTDASSVVCCLNPYKCQRTPEVKSTCAAGYYECPASLGGGCCLSGYTCMTSGCVQRPVERNDTNFTLNNGPQGPPGPPGQISLQDAMCAAGLHSEDCPANAPADEGGRPLLNASRFPKRDPSPESGRILMKVGKIVGIVDTEPAASSEVQFNGTEVEQPDPAANAAPETPNEYTTYGASDGTYGDVGEYGERDRTLTLVLTAVGINAEYQTLTVTRTNGIMTATPTEMGGNVISKVPQKISLDPTKAVPTGLIPLILTGLIPIPSQIASVATGLIPSIPTGAIPDMLPLNAPVPAPAFTRRPAKSEVLTLLCGDIMASGSSSAEPKTRRLIPGRKPRPGDDADGPRLDIAAVLSRTSSLPLPSASGLRERSISPVKRGAPKIYKHEEYRESNSSLLSNASFLPDTPSPLLPPDLKKLKAMRDGNAIDGKMFDDDDDDDDDDGPVMDADASVVERVRVLMHRNAGILLMLTAQVFASTMSVITRLLETGFETEFHALQILFARQTISVVLCSGYMWATKVPDFPLGPKSVRWLLVARGVGGFFGVFGLYYSLTYLDISDATVITFLAPSVAAFACYLLLKEPFTKTEALAGVISFVGVILIARPTAFFSTPASPSDSGSVGSGGSEPSPAQQTDGLSVNLRDVTPAQRITAVLVALIGVLGAATAFTTIRWIGKRAHPLISVNYFSAWCAIVSFVGLLVVPGIGFRWPRTGVQWALLAGIGVCGFIMQFLLTAALQRERAGLVTHMVYAQMVFALLWDKLIWDRLPSWASILGSALILGSAFWVAVRKNQTSKDPARVTRREARQELQTGDEERGLVAAKGSDDEGSGSDEDSVLDEDEARTLEDETAIQMRLMGR
ncbi:hypothetical protein Dda_4577 [Drechslerella dactyloides]|uniref:EamA domain-containing protein n=1 Tax=Drechslerella dactyloides TaxID=74499 RepID=A0AAD6NI25_DREDA|nr:hypothetical protein Dda_4577 [Drechslerella dactyloides]